MNIVNDVIVTITWSELSLFFCLHRKKNPAKGTFSKVWWSGRHSCLTKTMLEVQTLPLFTFWVRWHVRGLTVHEAFWKVQKTANLLQKNKEGDIGAQCGCQCALAGDQVETFGCLDGTLLPPGCVLRADSGCTVIRDHFPVAGVEKYKKLLWLRVYVQENTNSP